MSAVIVATDRDALDAETQLYEQTWDKLVAWGARCCPVRYDALPEGYRDTTLKLLHDVGRTWKRRRDWQEARRRRRAAAKKAAAARRRGAVKCEHCGTIYTSSDCPGCAELLTARGTQTHSFVAPPVEQLSASTETLRIDMIVANLPPWMRNALQRKFLWRLKDGKSAEDLMIPVAVFAGRVRAGVEAVARELAKPFAAGI